MVKTSIWERKGKYGFLWLAATVGSTNRSLPKIQLVKINVSEVCREIVSGEAQGPDSALKKINDKDSAGNMLEIEIDRVGGNRKRASLDGKHMGREKRSRVIKESGRVVTMGLRLSANLLLGVARVYDLQVQATNNDASQMYLDLRSTLYDGLKSPSKSTKKGKDGAVNFDSTEEKPHNLETPNEDALGVGLEFGLAHVLEEDDWGTWRNDENHLPFSGIVSTSGNRFRADHIDDGDSDEEIPRARGARTPDRESSFRLFRGASSDLINQGPGSTSQGGYSESNFDPGMDLELGLDDLLEDDGEDFDFEGTRWGLSGQKSSSPGLDGLENSSLQEFMGEGLDYGYMTDRYDQGNQGMDDMPIDFLDIPGAPVVPGLPPILGYKRSGTDRLNSDTQEQPKSILKRAGQKSSKKKRVKLVVMDKKLNHTDAEIQEWRRSYVNKQIEQRSLNKQQEEDRLAQNRVHELLNGMPKILGLQDGGLIELVLGQQNRRRLFSDAYEPSPKRPRTQHADKTERLEDCSEVGSEHQSRVEMRPYQVPEFADEEGMGIQGYDYYPEDRNDQGEDYMSLKAYEEIDRTIFSSEGDVGTDLRLRVRTSSELPWDTSSRQGRGSSMEGVEFEAPGGMPSSSAGYLSSIADSKVDVFVSRPHRRMSSIMSAPWVNGLNDDNTQNQSQGQSQGQSQNTKSFFAYVQDLLDELPLRSHSVSQKPSGLSIPLSTVVPIKSCTRAVAAKGFYQVLVLGTKDVVHISQPKDFGDIFIGLK